MFSSQFEGLATRSFCFIKDGNCDQAVKMMENVKFFMSRREQANSENQNFTKLKNLFNSVIDHFNSQSRVPARKAQGSSIARSHGQQRYNRNWRI